MDGSRCNVDWVDSGSVDALAVVARELEAGDCFVLSVLDASNTHS